MFFVKKQSGQGLITKIYKNIIREFKIFTNLLKTNDKKIKYKKFKNY